MKTNSRINKIEHIWLNESDRWVYIERHSCGYLGINFMQGDEYDYFHYNYCEIDRGLSEFYSTMVNELHMLKRDMSELEFIDKIIWIYFEATTKYDRYKQ